MPETDCDKKKKKMWKCVINQEKCGKIVTPEGNYEKLSVSWEIVRVGKYGWYEQLIVTSAALNCCIFCLSLQPPAVNRVKCEKQLAVDNRKNGLKESTFMTELYVSTDQQE